MYQLSFQVMHILFNLPCNPNNIKLRVGIKFDKHPLFKIQSHSIVLLVFAGWCTQWLDVYGEASDVPVRLT